MVNRFAINNCSFPTGSGEAEELKHKPVCEEEERTVHMGPAVARTHSQQL